MTPIWLGSIIPYCQMTVCTLVRLPLRRLLWEKRTFIFPSKNDHLGKIHVFRWWRLFPWSTNFYGDGGVPNIHTVYPAKSGTMASATEVYNVRTPLRQIPWADVLRWFMCFCWKVVWVGQREVWWWWCWGLCWRWWWWWWWWWWWSWCLWWWGCI